MTLKYYVGMFVATLFSLTYILTIPYSIIAIVYVVRYPGFPSLLFILPYVLSLIIPPIRLPWLTGSIFMGCLRDYFDFEQVNEISDEELLKTLDEYKKVGRSIIFPTVPHGVLSYGSLCAGGGPYLHPRLSMIPSAVAGAVLASPIIKHVMGIWGLIDASSPSLVKHLAKGGLEGSFILYPGGIAELFLCSEEEERLFLKSRKGFIKLALREGADIVPIYCFGNTTVLTIPKNKFLAEQSRKFQASLTIFWGKWGTPIPRDKKCIYVRGAPLGLPVIKNPTDEDVDKWHGKYLAEVLRLFDTYKHKLPEYKSKQLYID